MDECRDADGVSQRRPGLVEYRLPPARALESRRRRAEKDIAARRTDVDPYESSRLSAGSPTR